MKKEVFKILRCRCGWQRWDEQLLKEPGPCPKCEAQTRYSDDWYIKIIVDGKRHIKSIGRHQRQAAAVLRMAYDQQFQKRFFQQAEILYLSKAIEKVKKWDKNRTGNRAIRHIEIIIDIVGDIPISEVEAYYDDILEGLEDRKKGETEIKPATINRYRASLKTVLRKNHVPYDFIEMDREDGGRIRVITHAEEDKLLGLFSQTDIKRQRASAVRPINFQEMGELLPCLIDTGARTSEMLNITGRDIDLDNNMITFWDTKTGDPRSVPLTRRSYEILKRRKEHNPDKIWQVTLYAADDLWRSWVRPFMQIDDPLFRLYCTRHTCATRLVANGIDIYKIMKWMGHHNIKTTEKYAHLDPELLRDAAEALDLLQSTKHQRSA